ncbi:MAG: hypothetical protein KatS3mg031_2825 [Chitinophagales bacterium]|nr:MAG: hypothetical protein KatS3mg031_2825 [Chitinophagales bacterium]
MSRHKEIAEGFFNYLTGRRKDIAVKRYPICLACDKKKETMGVLRCSVCGCVLKAKVASPLSSCPLGKWDKEEE